MEPGWRTPTTERSTPAGCGRRPKGPLPQRGNPYHQPIRTVSVIRYGIGWLRRLLHQARLWRRVWLLPEPWPEPNPNMQIIRHAPS